MKIELNFPNPVTTAADLFDREAEMAEIQETLQSPTRRPVVIIGERVIGKTSLLNVVGEWIEQEQMAIGLNVPHAYSRDGLAAEIMQGICAEVGADLRHTGLINAQGQFNLATLSEYVGVARQLVDQKRNVRFVLCLDEFDSLLSKCDDAATDQILDFVLYLIEQTDLPLRFLFTMTQIADRMQQSYPSPFLNSANLVQLAPWTFEASYQFVDWLLQGRFVFSEEAQRQIFAAAGGHPYFTKAVLQSLMDQNRGKPEGFSITLELAKSAVDATIHLPEVDFTLDNIAKAHFTTEDKLLLTTLASKPEGLNMETIRNLGDPYLETAEELVRRGYFSKQEGVYQLRLGLVGAGLAQRPFTSVVSTTVEDRGSIMSEIEPSSGIVLNETSKRVWVDGGEINLTNIEYHTLLTLARRAGEVVSKKELVEEVWPEEAQLGGISDTRIDQIIYRIRKKLTAAHYLDTEREEGYVLSNTRITRDEPDAVVSKKFARGLRD